MGAGRRRTRDRGRAAPLPPGPRAGDHRRARRPRSPGDRRPCRRVPPGRRVGGRRSARRVAGSVTSSRARRVARTGSIGRQWDPQPTRRRRCCATAHRQLSRTTTADGSARRADVLQAVQPPQTPALTGRRSRRVSPRRRMNPELPAKMPNQSLLTYQGVCITCRYSPLERKPHEAPQDPYRSSRNAGRA